MKTSYPVLDPLLIDRYLAGSALPEERIALARQLGIDAAQLGDAAVEHLLRTGGATLPAHVQSDDRSALLQRIRTSEASHRNRPSQRGRILTRMGLAVAASALVAIGFQWKSHHDHSRTSPELAQNYHAAIGERKTVTLADGSHVTLAPQTTLQVPATFGTTNRTLSVTGEAYFEIVHGGPTPFVVRAGSVETRVLGTRFDVRRYMDDRNVRVIVTDGKVAVGRRAHSTAIVTAGRSAIVTDSSITVSDRSAVSTYMDWPTGKLVFERASVPDVLAMLSQWYGVLFRMSDSSLQSRHVTGALTYGSQTDMLTTIKNLLDVTLAYDRNPAGVLTVTLQLRRSGSALRPSRNNALPTLLPSSTTFGR